MYIVIAGAGNISEEIAISLLSSGDEVHMIDVESTIVDKINTNIGNSYISVPPPQNHL